MVDYNKRMMKVIGISILTLLGMIGLTFVELPPILEISITTLMVLVNLGILFLCTFEMPVIVKQFINKYRS